MRYSLNNFDGAYFNRHYKQPCCVWWLITFLIIFGLLSKKSTDAVDRLSNETKMKTSIDVVPSKNQALCESCTLVSKLKHC